MPKHPKQPEPKSPKYCPRCGRRGACVESRHRDASIVRRYECARCGRWSTVESVLTAPAKRGSRGPAQKPKRASRSDLGWLARLNSKLETT